MGNCCSATTGVGGGGFLLNETDGGEEEFHSHFLENAELGEGEFAVVRQIYDLRTNPREAYACKYLKKGMTFKNNTLYSPIKPEVLMAEVEILRTLQGKHYCLNLKALYESPKQIYVVTELCNGGEMPQWVAQQTQDLRTEDVSRISFELISAVDHCAKHQIIHRDIKPENILFTHSSVDAEMRLVDFGSGTNRPPSGKDEKNPSHHTTFAGSAFYISPEMFQKTYTSKTDVWSVGATLYVLVAGYPADCLQKAFNILQSSSKDRNLRNLPNLPEDMPDDYYDMLEQLLTYRHKSRKSAGDLLSHDFVQLYNQLKKKSSEDNDESGLSVEQVSAAAANNPSFFLPGSVKRHSAFMDYLKFERSLTTLLATLLTREEFERFITILKDRTQKDIMSANMNSHHDDAATTQTTSAEQHENVSSDSHHSHTMAEDKLHVLSVSDIKQILKDDLKNDKIIYMIEKLKGAEYYDDFAYEVSLIRDFSRQGDAAGGSNNNKGKRKSWTSSSNGSRSMDGSLRGLRANIRNRLGGAARSVDGSLRGKFRGGRGGNKSMDGSLKGKGRLGGNKKTPSASAIVGQ